MPRANGMADLPSRPSSGPYQFERRKQPPALVSLHDAARDQLAGHCGGVQALSAEAAGHPKALSQLADLRHAVHGLPDRTAKRMGDLDLAELWKDGRDAALDGR